MVVPVYHPMPSRKFSRFSACRTGKYPCNYSLDPPKSGQDSDQMCANITAHKKHDSGESQAQNGVAISPSSAELGLI